MDAPATLRDSIAMVNLQRKTGIEIDTGIFDEDIEFGVVDYPGCARPEDLDGHAWANDRSVTGDQPSVGARQQWEEDSDSESDF